MATLADSFLQDLEDLEEPDPEADEPAAKKAKKGKKALPVEKDLSIASLVEDEEGDEIPDAIQVFMNNEKSGSSSVSEMLKRRVSEAHG